MPVNQYPRHSGGRFLSLKWKIMLLPAVALLAANGTLSWLAYRDQVAQFEEQRADLRDQHLAEARALLQESSQRARQVADMLASYAGAAGLSQTENGMRQLQRAFDAYWASLQVNLGLDALVLYDAEGKMLSEWSGSPPVGAQEAARVATALRDEKSAAWLECPFECIQSAVAPVLSRGRVAGAVIVSGSLADMIGAFRRLTGADIGLLAPTTESGGGHPLPRLGFSVAGITRGEQNIHLLEQLDRLPPEKNGRRWISLQQGDRHFDVAFIRMEEARPGTLAPMMVVIEDVSAGYWLIRSRVLGQLAGEATALLVALTLLAAFLNAPLRRMTRAAESIPLLGQRAFAQVRARIRPRTGQILTDEIDHLDLAAVELSSQLESLEVEVRDNAEQLQRMLDRISVERDFNQSLLDTAQVIVLVQTPEGEVHSINRYGEQLTGWSEEELKGRRFFEVSCSKLDVAQSNQQLVSEVASGDREHLQQECILVGRDGTEHEIAWNHSRLASQGDRPALVLSIGADITARKRAENRIAYLAEHDALTGLFNRQHFQKELERALATASRTNREGALLYLDLDGFKYVNDVSGHQAGDALLRRVADELAAATRVEDLLGRLGGDEIGILLHECELDGAVEVAQKINRRLAEIKFPGLSGIHHISASIGIVHFPAADMDVKQILANADIAMYQAKSSGRARWHLFSEGEHMQEKLQQWVRQEERIKAALQENGFVVQYQPILDIHSGTVSHYEALARMRGEDGGLIPPAEFIEVAERTGLIRELDRHVLHMVVDRLLELLAAGQTYKIAVNLSGVSISDETLLDFLRQELGRSPELPHYLIFEITETAAVGDFVAAKDFMEAVRELGVAFSLDDFGVGFSSFYYVKHLPVDYLKIDGSFIRTLADSPDDQVFVRALAEVARGFGKKTVAEFVGDERVLSLLRAFGVDYAQGYHIGKPGDAPGAS